MNPTLDDLSRHYAASEPLRGAEQRVLARITSQAASRPRRRWRKLAVGAGVVAVVTGISTATASVWMPDAVREDFSWSAPGTYNPDLSTVRAVLTTTWPSGPTLTLWTAKAKWTPDSLIFGRGLCITVATGDSKPSTGPDNSKSLVSGCGRVSDSEMRRTGYLKGGAAGQGSAQYMSTHNVGVYRVPGAARARIEFADGTGGDYEVGDGWAVLPIAGSDAYPATLVGLDASGNETGRATIKDPFPDFAR